MVGRRYIPPRATNLILHFIVDCNYVGIDFVIYYFLKFILEKPEHST